MIFWEVVGLFVWKRQILTQKNLGKKFFTNKINFSSTKHSCNFQGNFLNREASLAFDNFSADITLNPSYLMNGTNDKTASKNLMSSISQKKSKNLRYLHSLSLEQNNKVILLLIFIICLVERIYKKSKFL